MDSNPAGIFILVAILLAAIVGVVYLMVTTKHGSQLNVQRYQTKWLEIENSVTRDNAASWQLAIINADKLLDQALRERRFRGQTMGERMKSATEKLGECIMKSARKTAEAATQFAYGSSGKMQRGNRASIGLEERA